MSANNIIPVLNAAGFSETGQNVMTRNNGSELWYGWDQVTTGLVVKADLFDSLIAHMKTCGWSQVPGSGDKGGYVIVNPGVTDDEYETWEEAIKATIEVGSDV